jgi:hypothetical protein
VLVLVGFLRLIGWNTNLEARRQFSATADFSALIDSYNARQSNESRAGLMTDGDDLVLSMAQVQTTPPFDGKIEVIDQRLGARQQVMLWNYWPLSVPATPDDAQFLASPFPADKGLRFEDGWRAWIAMNRAAAGRLPRWMPGEPVILSTPTDDARLEIMFDLSETALGGSRLSALRDEAYDLFERARWPRLPTQAEPFDAEFVEAPFAIYRIGPDAILWDHLRSRALFCAISRRAMRIATGDDVRSKGRAFEAVVARAIQQRLALAAPPTENVVIAEGGQSVLEMDVAFVWQGVLVLVECKSLQIPRSRAPSSSCVAPMSNTSRASTRHTG